jgi:hypothetical protein
MAVTDISQPVQQIAQTAAIVLGGAWGYAKFVRGRTFRPRGSMLRSRSRISKLTLS